jgi:hypothetical protein
MRRKPAVATARNLLPMFVLLFNRIDSHSAGTNLLRALRCSFQSAMSRNSPATVPGNRRSLASLPIKVLGTRGFLGSFLREAGSIPSKVTAWDERL